MLQMLSQWAGPRASLSTAGDRFGAQNGAKEAPREGLESISESKMTGKYVFLQICSEKLILRKSLFYLSKSIDSEGSAAWKFGNFCNFRIIFAIFCKILQILTDFCKFLQNSCYQAMEDQPQSTRQHLPLYIF